CCLEEGRLSLRCCNEPNDELERHVISRGDIRSLLYPVPATDAFPRSPWMPRDGARRPGDDPTVHSSPTPQRRRPSGDSSTPCSAVMQWTRMRRTRRAWKWITN